MNPGDELQSFIIKETLGHGGMGGVFVGENKDSGELVAIKTLFEEFSKDEAYVRRFQREASVYRQLSHPNIVEFISSGFDHDCYFIAMEHITGKPLDVLLKEDFVFPVDDVLLHVTALASAVSHAHSRRIIHRDIKPQNIMIRQDGVIKLLDFGVAQTDDDLVKTATGSIVGTFFYASPEQNQGHKIDERSDLYSLGLVFYEMLTGQRALGGSTLLEIATTQRLGDIPSPDTIRPEIPGPVATLVMRLLEKDPNQRFQSARDLENHLKRCLGSATEVAAPVRPATSGGAEKEFDMLWSRAKEALARRELDKALELANGLTALDNDRGDVRCFLGKIHAAKGFSFNAIEEFQKAISLEPTNYQFKIDYAVALYSLNLIDKSREEFVRVIELDPENPFAKQYLQLIAETDSSRNNQIPDPARIGTGKFNLSASQIGGAKLPVMPPVRPESGSGQFRSVPPPQRAVRTTTPVAEPAHGQPSIPSISATRPSVAMKGPVAVPPPQRLATPQQAGSGSSVPSHGRTALIPPPNHSIPTPPPAASGTGSIPPPVRGGVKGPPEAFYGAKPEKRGSAREMVLGRNPQTSEPVNPQKAPSQSVSDGGPNRPIVKSSKKSRSKRKSEQDDGSVIIPDTARFWSYVWWGAGKLYGGSIQGALFWSFAELLLLMMIILPSLYIFMPELGVWQNPELDLRVLEKTVMSIGNSQIRNGLRAIISPLADSSFNSILAEHSRNYLHIPMLLVGVLLFIWYEFKLPQALFRQILNENMRGYIIEVRQDLTIKIDIGEDKGVKTGYIFAVKKKKHINQVSGGDFKTMVMAPTWFVAGKAKVLSTATSFSICKFKRLSGEASSPSIGDAVVVMKSDL